MQQQIEKLNAGQEALRKQELDHFLQLLLHSLNLRPAAPAAAAAPPVDALLADVSSPR